MAVISLTTLFSVVASLASVRGNTGVEYNPDQDTITGKCRDHLVVKEVDGRCLEMAPFEMNGAGAGMLCGAYTNKLMAVRNQNEVKTLGKYLAGFKLEPCMLRAGVWAWTPDMAAVGLAPPVIGDDDDSDDDDDRGKGDCMVVQRREGRLRLRRTSCDNKFFVVCEQIIP